MVKFTRIDLDNDKQYWMDPIGNEWDSDRFRKAAAGIDKFMKTGHPVSAIIPERQLSKEEVEEYREYFCKYAKRVKRNCIYFDFPVQVKEL